MKAVEEDEEEEEDHDEDHPHPWTLNNSCCWRTTFWHFGQPSKGDMIQSSHHPSIQKRFKKDKKYKV